MESKKTMTIEEAEEIIDNMYQKRMKENIGDGNVIHVDGLDNVKFTELEFASVRELRECQSLREKIKELNNVIDAMAEEIKLKRYYTYVNDLQWNELKKEIIEEFTIKAGGEEDVKFSKEIKR